MLVDEDLSHSVIGAFFKVYNTLGFGFLEHVYSVALEYELRRRGHDVQREFAVNIYYDGFLLTQQRLDVVVDGRLVVEVKASERLHRDACRQLYNYLRASQLEVGLLLHFNRTADFYRVLCRNSKSSSRGRHDEPG